MCGEEMSVEADFFQVFVAPSFFEKGVFIMIKEGIKNTCPFNDAAT